MITLILMAQLAQPCVPPPGRITAQCNWMVNADQHRIRPDNRPHWGPRYV